MKNRQYYITNKNEHDMMMDIRLNTNGCPIYILTGRSHLHERHGVACILDIGNCSSCINDWLNREVET